MTTINRNATIASSRQALVELIALGQAQGTFTVIEQRAPDSSESWSWVTIRTPAGHTFEFRAGSWSREGKITVGLAVLGEERGIRVKPGDVLNYQESPPEASASYDRGAAALLKTFTARMLNLPEAHAISTKMQERLAELQGQGSSLQQHMTTLYAQGFRFRELPIGETYQARGHGPDASALRHSGVTLNHTGTLDIERLEVPISKIDALMALLKD